MEKLYSVFQPIYLLETEKVYGYEALLRGIVSPLEMFREAKRNNTLINLDLQAIQLALDTFGMQEEKFLFLNCHPYTFSKVDLYPFIHLHRKTLSDRIVIEVTEHEELCDQKDIKRKVEKLKAQGFQLAIDDFGHGYTNLSLIELLEPDFIKLDRCLIKNLLECQKVRSLIRGIVEMAKYIDSIVIVEGLENSEQVNVIQECGIQYGQGKVLGKPMPLTAAAY